MLRFIVGLSIGLCLGLMMLLASRRRGNAKLKRLLSRLEERQPLPDLGYDAQLASAITSQQAQSETLNEQLQDLQGVLKNAPLGYLQVDEENRLLWCNQRAQEFLDIGQSDYAQPRLLLAVVRSYELDQLVERTRRRQMPCEAGWTFNSISTDPFNYLERPAYPLQGYGLPMSHGHVGVFLENRQEAVSLAQQRDRWISDVAHELKTPLTSIRLVAETLQSRVEPALIIWVDRLLNEVIRLSRLVDDVLNMSHLEQRQNGKPIEAGEAVDLVTLVQAAWESLEPLAQLKQVNLSYEGPDQLIAQVNASLMHRALFNLMNNAVKYSPSDHCIQVRLSTPISPASEAQSGAIADPPSGLPSGLPSGVTSNIAFGAEPGIVIDVIDAGIGLTDKDLPHVFDRFYRADPARSREKGSEDHARGVDFNSAKAADLPSSGTGLGLAIVRQIVVSHEGRVDAKKRPVRGGGWLRVWLPRSRLVNTAM